MGGVVSVGSLSEALSLGFFFCWDIQGREGGSQVPPMDGSEWWKSMGRGGFCSKEDVW